MEKRFSITNIFFLVFFLGGGLSVLFVYYWLLSDPNPQASWTDWLMIKVAVPLQGYVLLIIGLNTLHNMICGMSNRYSLGIGQKIESYGGFVCWYLAYMIIVLGHKIVTFIHGVFRWLVVINTEIVDKTKRRQKAQLTRRAN